MSNGNVIAVILGGGRGTRLFPLTRDRAKPSVPIAGKFRLVDIPISNCLHSGLEKIYVLTQFNSASLNRHIAQTYRFDTYRRGFVQILAAQQTLMGEEWYQGTADAIKHNEPYILNPRFKDDYVLILAGDHLYRMDYEKMLQVHTESNAAITVSVLPVKKEDTSGLGILQADANGRIVDFVEKPQTEEELQRLRVEPEVFTSRGIEPQGREYIASMGIYIFNREVLQEVLQDESNVDFGKDIIPKNIQTRPVSAYFFDGYWEDIGTIRSFYSANIALTDTAPAFNFYDEQAPIYTNRRHLPSTKVNSSSVRSSILAEGSIIDDSELDRTIVGIRSIISGGSRVYQSVLMGADYYESDAARAAREQSDIPKVGIGRNCLIQNAIIDKNARIGDNSVLVNRDGIDNYDGDDYYIREGIVIVPKDATIPPETVV
ncbi:glucose-1-phosphate adenylyltransferase [Candidatus Poribacteria bacterium]|nr:glucose-1-phosphate adenylyltransferase [Candidatus Poribacteria bacterium]MYG08673.1 glucose-1-phosphate adenylyltransferase [Candidatus Poribacteria bacterium]MYK21530.1 glucose-1-phosphate adenylyltransferase [Candidatus Poribacteria bacterium]